MTRLRYSRWDGTQVGFELDADDVMAQLNDDLLYHGDLNAALRRMLQQGFKDRNGERVQGMREMLEQLRRKREKTLDQYDLGGVYDEINEALNEVTDLEREHLQNQLDRANESGDPRRQETAQNTADNKRMELDLMPQDLASKVQALSNYEFTSPEAQQRFEELMEQLRQQVMDNFMGKMNQSIQNMTPEDMARMKDMYSSLNKMLEQRNNGEPIDPSFEQFMENFGDFFPENPQTLDELLEAIAERMAAAQQMLNSMTPEQRAQMQSLMDQLMQDMDLRWQVEQLGQNLQQAFPSMNWGQGRNFRGDQGVGMGEAVDLMQQMGNMDALENLMRNAAQPGALNEVDLDAARDLLGDDAAKSLDKLAQLAKMLEEAGMIQQKEGRLELTPKGMRRIGANALDELFSKLVRSAMGRHQITRSGVGTENTFETKQYEYGDPFALSIERTVRNAVSRQGSGTPVKLTPEDFEIERTETLVRSSTVLMLDLSLSMEMRGNFLAAKKVVMALHSLISTMYPRDFLGIVTFSEVAKELTPEKLPEVSWDFVYGTNMQHGFALSRRMLAKQPGTKQIIMITDGEPTAHIMPNGEPFFSYPPVPETIRATLNEVMRLTKDGITINTFMLDATPYLKAFIERVTEMNKGRAFFTTPETLGDYVLVDFIEQKRRMRQRTGRR